MEFLKIKETEKFRFQFIFSGFFFFLIFLLPFSILRELKVGDFGSVPRGMSIRSFQSDNLSEAGLVGESLLLTFPEVLFVLFGELPHAFHIENRKYR